MLPEIWVFNTEVSWNQSQTSAPVPSFQVPAKIVAELGAQSSNVRDYEPHFRSALAGSLAPGNKEQPIVLTV